MLQNSATSSADHQQQTFGDWLRQYRHSHDLTRQELANLIGCAANTIKKYEQNERRPSKAMLQRFFEVLNVPSNEQPALTYLARLKTLEDEDPAIPTHADYSLPVPLTTLIGQDTALNTLIPWMSDIKRRLITLTGTGGVGKTCLALHVAQKVGRSFQDGAAWIELVHIQTESLMLEVIAQAVGLRSETGELNIQHLIEHLRAKHFLLILDNFEHLLESAPFLYQLIRHCEQLTILVTSRYTLQLTGESVYEVMPLEIPLADTSIEIMRSISAVDFFIERAQAAYPDFVLTESNAAAVQTICQRLDGIPLALELAAARIPLLTPMAIAQHLQQGLRLLATRRKDVLPHHQSLHDAIAWSFELLSLQAQSIFISIGIFRGDCSIDAIQKLCGYSATKAEPYIFDSLEELLRGHLIYAITDDLGERRFGMLETLREFAAEQLAQAPNVEVIYQRFRTFYQELIQKSDVHLSGQEQQIWLARLDLEYPNIQRTLQLLLLEDDPSDLLNTILILVRFWYIRGYLNEGVYWFKQTLARVGDLESAAVARIRGNFAIFLASQGNFDEAEQIFYQNINYFRAIQDPLQLVKSLSNLSSLKYRRGQTAEALMLIRETFRYKSEIEDCWEVANMHFNLGTILEQAADLQEATNHLIIATDLFRQCGDRARVAMTLSNRGYLVQYSDPEQAYELYEESIAISRELDERVNLAIALSNMAELAFNSGHMPKALEVLRESIMLYKIINAPMFLPYALVRAAMLLNHYQEQELAVMSLACVQVIRSPGFVNFLSAQKVEAALIKNLREHMPIDVWEYYWNKGKAMKQSEILQRLEQVFSTLATNESF